MTILEQLHVFGVGDKVTAEETNDNNQTLEAWINDHTEVNNYIDGKIATLTTNLNRQISSLNNQIATKAPLSNPTLTGTVNVPNNAAVGTAIATAAISKAKNGYLKLGNGILIQWGYYSGVINSTTVTITLPTSFSNANYCLLRTNHTTITGSGKYGGANPSMSYYSKSNSKFVVWGFEDDFNKGFSWFAIGY